MIRILSIQYCMRNLTAFILLLIHVRYTSAFSSKHVVINPTVCLKKEGYNNLTTLSNRKKSEEVVGYVPSGLTPEQYAKIKKAEMEKKQKMDFGAWGPRFAKSNRPDGDWMIVPSLWTNGFSNNAQYSSGSTSTSNNKGLVLRNALINGFKRIVPVYLTLLFIVEMTFSSIHVKSSLFTMMCSQIIKKDPMSAFIASFGGNMLKFGLAKMAVAGILVKPYFMLVERCNRRLLWSPRRTMTLSSISTSSLFFVSMLVRLLL